MYPLFILAAALLLASSAPAQIQDHGTWPASEAVKALGIESVSVHREGQSRESWIVYVDLHGPDDSPMGTMEFRWPDENSRDLRWDKPSGESYVFRQKMGGLESMEFEDITAGELIKWEALCDMSALAEKHNEEQRRDESNVEIMTQESLDCGRQVAVTGTDMELEESLEHYTPLWLAMQSVEGLIRTRFGFSEMQLLREKISKRKAARESKRLNEEDRPKGRIFRPQGVGGGGYSESSGSGLLKFQFCPPGNDMSCPFPAPPSEFQVLGIAFASSAAQCGLDAWDVADERCNEKTQMDCCAISGYTITNFFCPLFGCHCQRIGVIWGCTASCT